MKTLTFKTNIKCSGCINRVTPQLNNTKGIVKWSVDIFTPEKTLTVEVDGIELKDIVDAVNKAGFIAEEKQ